MSGEKDYVASDEDEKEHVVEKELRLNEYSQYDEDAQRRKVRAEYRELSKVIEENAQEIIQPESAKIAECLNLGETLFSKVRRPREAAHDSTYLLSLTKRSREQAQELKTDIVSFDNNTFIQKLISSVNGYDITSTSTDDDIVDLPTDCWKTLGKRVVSLFKRAPTFDFLLGPLVIELEIKERQRNVRRKEEGPIEVEKLKQIDSVDKQEEATTKEVERIFKILKHLCDGGKEKIPFFPFIVNPESFGQTVENIFHFAFLVKDGRAIIELDEDGLPTVSFHRQYREEDYEETISRKQVVMPLTMKDWKELINVFEIKKAIIPTRSKIN